MTEENIFTEDEHNEIWKEAQEEFRKDIIKFLEDRWDSNKVENDKEKSLVLSLQKFMMDKLGINPFKEK